MLSNTPSDGQPIFHLSGFTLIELVLMIMFVGILSVVVMPRFADKTFDERGFHDAVKTLLQHGRHIAVASRRFVCIEVDAAAGVVSLTHDTALPDDKATITCNTDLKLPSLGRGCSQTNQICAPKGVSITGTDSLIFDPLGRLVNAPSSVASAASITISNQASITVVPETGYVE
jgi:MSHA pilin protein MshC